MNPEGKFENVAAAQPLAPAQRPPGTAHIGIHQERSTGEFIFSRMINGQLHTSSPTAFPVLSAACAAHDLHLLENAGLTPTQARERGLNWDLGHCSNPRVGELLVGTTPESAFKLVRRQLAGAETRRKHSKGRGGSSRGNGRSAAAVVPEPAGEEESFEPGLLLGLSEAEAPEERRPDTELYPPIPVATLEPEPVVILPPLVQLQAQPQSGSATKGHKSRARGRFPAPEGPAPPAVTEPPPPLKPKLLSRAEIEDDKARIEEALQALERQGPVKEEPAVEQGPLLFPPEPAAPHSIPALVPPSTARRARPPLPSSSAKAAKPPKQSPPPPSPRQPASARPHKAKLSPPPAQVRAHPSSPVQAPQDPASSHPPPELLQKLNMSLEEFERLPIAPPAPPNRRPPHVDSVGLKPGASTGSGQRYSFQRSINGKNYQASRTWSTKTESAIEHDRFMLDVAGAVARARGTNYDLLVHSDPVVGRLFSLYGAPPDTAFSLYQKRGPTSLDLKTMGAGGAGAGAGGSPTSGPFSSHSGGAGPSQLQLAARAPDVEVGGHVLRGGDRTVHAVAALSAGSGPISGRKRVRGGGEHEVHQGGEPPRTGPGRPHLETPALPPSKRQAGSGRGEPGHQGEEEGPAESMPRGQAGKPQARGTDSVGSHGSTGRDQDQAGTSTAVAPKGGRGRKGKGGRGGRGGGRKGPQKGKRGAKSAAASAPEEMPVDPSPQPPPQPSFNPYNSPAFFHQLVASSGAGPVNFYGLPFGLAGPLHPFFLMPQQTQGTAQAASDREGPQGAAGQLFCFVAPASPPGPGPEMPEDQPAQAHEGGGGGGSDGNGDRPGSV